MSLMEGRAGAKYRVVKVCLQEKAKRRFEILGMTQGCVVEIAGRKRRGTMIIKIRGTRFAIGRAFAQGILVEEAS